MLKNDCDRKVGVEKKKVGILPTGGTIGGIRNPKTGAVEPPKTPKDFLLLIPEIKDICEIEVRPVEFSFSGKRSEPMNILSEDMTPECWKAIAQNVARENNRYDIYGVVITHGTFTIGYTSAALSFMLGESLNKPVILTGAQRPIEEIRQHTVSNLVNSISTAANSNIAEVAICFSGDSKSSFSYVYRGTRTRKNYAWQMDPYRSIGVDPIAKVTEGKIEMLMEDYKKRNNSKKVNADTKIDDKVVALEGFPGFAPQIIHEFIDRGYHGIVLEGYADGSVSTISESKKSLIPAIKRATDEGMPICVTGQPFGRVTLTEYASGVDMLKVGAIPMGDMITETAMVKLMWVLGHTKDLDEVEEMMHKNYVGEITPNSWGNKSKWHI